MNKVTFMIVVALSFFFTQTSPSLSSEKSKFKSAFKKHKCITCHSVSKYRLGDLTQDNEDEDEDEDEDDSVTNRDLSSLSPFVMKHPSGPRVFLKKYIRKRIKKNGSRHMFMYKGSDADLDVLINHLLKLSKPAKNKRKKSGK